MPTLHCKPYLVAGVFGLAIVLSVPVAAQSTPALDPAPTPTPASPAAPSSNTSNSQAPSQDQSLDTLKVNVEVVQLFFNVKDKHGALIPNLTKENFDLFEDGQPQTIKYFKAESDLPLTLG
ncbi:MAG: hypothetical protein WBP70_17920, partial [Terriglobales bacterium]